MMRASRTMMALASAMIAVLATAAAVNGQELGNGKFGCYDIMVHTCDCDPGVCSKEACEGRDPSKYFLTEGCTSCSCANSAGLAAAVATAAEGVEAVSEPAATVPAEGGGGDGSDGAQPEVTEDAAVSGPGPVGALHMGCYRLEDHVCLCTPDVCSEELCTGQGTLGQFFYTDGCHSCTCGALGADGSIAVDAQQGYGCYDSTVHGCSCSPETCGETVCESQSEFHAWTDKCSSCQCSAEDIKRNERPEEEGAENLLSNGATTDAPVLVIVCSVIASVVGISVIVFVTRVTRSSPPSPKYETAVNGEEIL